METKDSMFILAIVGIVAIVGLIILITGTRTSMVTYEDAAGRAIVVTKQTLLEGDGNAYACIDSQGNLFRSEEPCR